MWNLALQSTIVEYSLASAVLICAVFRSVLERLFMKAHQKNGLCVTATVTIWILSNVPWGAGKEKIPLDVVPQICHSKYTLSNQIGIKDQLVRPLVRRDKTAGHKRMFAHLVLDSIDLRGGVWRVLGVYEKWILHRILFLSSGKKEMWQFFNNHAMIDTSTPWELYKGKERRFRLTFLNSKRMFEDDWPWLSTNPYLHNPAPESSRTLFCCYTRAKIHDTIHNH